MLLIVAVTVVVLAGLGYAAHSFNLVGMILSAHTPPQH
jgi:hypothetical protein